MNKPTWEFTFGFDNVSFRFLPHFEKGKLEWKDKFGSPRVERVPYFMISWLGVYIYATRGSEDQAWEQYIWTKIYCHGDKNIAKDSWMWRNTSGVSTWVDYED